MILSVSRRTDIPAFYSEWFMNRMHEGFVLVRNPMNYHQVSRVSLSPTVIDCIVFWTKNAEPMLPFLDEVSKKYPFYFQYTLNGYDGDIERNLPALEKKIHTFKKISHQIGSEKVIWRYDPILLTEKYTIDWHIGRFQQIAKALKGYTDTSVFSFVDIYDKVKSNVKGLDMRSCTIEEMALVAKAFSEITKENGMILQTCAEAIDLDQYEIQHGCCIDRKKIEAITGKSLDAKKDQNQRPECGCLESIDIGQYNTCRHGCRYCYANFNPQSVITFSKQHDPSSPFLIGGSEDGDKITERKMKSLLNDMNEQLSMF